MKKENMEVLAGEDRAADMESRFRNGETLDDIGQRYNISRERVRQILAKRGLGRKDGGQSVTSQERARKKAQERMEKKDARAAEVFQCPYDIVLKNNHGQKPWHPKSPAALYLHQRRNALKLKIKWEISFLEWRTIWTDEVLARKDEQGLHMVRRDKKKGFMNGNIDVLPGIAYKSIDRDVRDRSIFNELSSGKSLREVSEQYNLSVSGVARIKQKIQHSQQVNA